MIPTCVAKNESATRYENVTCSMWHTVCHILIPQVNDYKLVFKIKHFVCERFRLWINEHKPCFESPESSLMARKNEDKTKMNQKCFIFSFSSHQEDSGTFKTYFIFIVSCISHKQNILSFIALVFLNIATYAMILKL